MPGLMIGGRLLLVLGHDHRAALRAHHDLVLGFLELVRGNQALALACGKERRLICKVCKISARKAGGAAREAAKADIGDRKSTRRNSIHVKISYAVFCLK